MKRAYRPRWLRQEKASLPLESGPINPFKITNKLWSYHACAENG